MESNIKIEPPDLSIIKTEPLDTYETTIEESSTFTNCLETFSETYDCKICFEVFNNYEEYVVHKNLFHKDQPKPYKCLVCDEKFCLITHLNNHLLTHVNNVSPSNSVSTLTLPMATPSSSVPPSCPIINLKRSFRKRRLTQKSADNMCQINSQPDVTDEIVQITSDIKPLKCPNCNFSFVSRLKFVRHKNKCTEISNVNVNKSYLCDLCTRGFKSRSALSGHMRFHSLRGHMISKRSLRGKKRKKLVLENSQVNDISQSLKNKFICKICNKQFVLEKRFLTHLLIHTNSISLNSKETPEEPTKRKSEVKQSCSKYKPFQCIICKHYYSSKPSLEGHIRLFHTLGKPTYSFNKPNASKKCNWCNRIISNRNFIRHVSSFHPKVKLVSCDDCPLKFKDIASLNIHVSKSHKT